MSLLLKIKSSQVFDNNAHVPLRKSVRLASSDIGEEVFIWFADTPSEKSALRFRTHLRDVNEISLPQVRDPSKCKPGYQLTFSSNMEIAGRPFLTEDLKAVRYSEGDSAFERLGKLHRDRNDKIIRISEKEAQFLAQYF